MKYDKACKTERDKAEYCEQLKAELIADHNAQTTEAGRKAVIKKMRIVSHWGRQHKLKAGLVTADLKDEAKLAELSKFEEDAKKDKKYVCDHNIDFKVEAPLTRIAGD